MKPKFLPCPASRHTLPGGRATRVALCFLTLVAAATAAPFTAGNIAIYRVGSGTGSLINTGNEVFIDEYTPAGVLQQSIPMPTSVVGANKRLIAGGTATSEGMLTRSTDGRFLIATGYDAAPPVTSLTSTASATGAPDSRRAVTQAP